jgi:hypothetical protein
MPSLGALHNQHSEMDSKRVFFLEKRAEALTTVTDCLKTQESLDEHETAQHERPQFTQQNPVQVGQSLRQVSARCC